MGGDIDRNPGPKRALPPRGRDVQVQDVLPTTEGCDVAVTEFEEYLRVRDMPGLEELVSCGLNELGHACIQCLRVCFASGSLGLDQAVTLISGLRRHVLATCSCRADQEEQSVFRTLWRVHGNWSLAIPAEFRKPVSHEIVLSVAASAWLHNVPELSLSTLLSFHSLLRPAEARQLRWCDVETFDRSLSADSTPDRTRTHAHFLVCHIALMRSLHGSRCPRVKRVCVIFSVFHLHLIA